MSTISALQSPLTQQQGEVPVFLTEPSTPKHNRRRDNEDYDLIVKLNDVLGSATSFEGRYYSANPETVSRYKIISKLGNGMFGQEFKAHDMIRNIDVAIKVLKSKSNFFRQGMLEIAILSMMKDIYDKIVLTLSVLLTISCITIIYVLLMSYLERTFIR